MYSSRFVTTDFFVTETHAAALSRYYFWLSNQLVVVLGPFQIFYTLQMSNLQANNLQHFWGSFFLQDRNNDSFLPVTRYITFVE